MFYSNFDKLFLNNKVLFLISGILNTSFNYASICFFIYFGLHAITAQFLAGVLSVIFNYYSYAKIVFRGRKGSYIKFLLNHLLNYLCSLVFLIILGWWISNPYFSSGLAIFFTVIINYAILSKWVFKATT